MSPERYEQAGRLYHAALEIEPEARASFLDDACGADLELRREVESLLAAHDRVGNYFASPALEVAAGLVSEHRNPSLLGQSLSHYRVISLIGAGGMGEVYLAEDTQLRRKVALKLLPKEFAEDRERLRRFEQEARAAGMLNHPNVLTIYDIGSYEGTPYIASEALTGETLRERLRGAVLPLRRVVDYAMQIARGLAATHEKGIIHRDLKPENLFVTKDGRVKILDFGLAKLKPLLTVSPPGVDTRASTQRLGTDPGMVMGTVGYMSPEQVRAEEVDHRSDIFAFGAILYEMLTGRRAFEGQSAVEVMNAILKEEPPEISEPKREVPPVLVRVIRHCLEKSREERFQSIADVVVCLDTLPVEADRQTSDPEGAQPRSVARRWMSVAAAAIALAAAITIWQAQPAGELWENPLVNAHIERVTDFQGSETDAAISSDGKFIVFLSDRDGNFDAWLNHVGSGAFVNLTKGRFSQLPHQEVRTYILRAAFRQTNWMCGAFLPTAASRSV